jgi:hypothetical protein
MRAASASLTATVYVTPGHSSSATGLPVAASVMMALMFLKLAAVQQGVQCGASAQAQADQARTRHHGHMCSHNQALPLPTALRVLQC